MRGKVEGREARIKLTVCGPNDRRKRIVAVVDTGSEGWLTLPQKVIGELGLPRTGSVRAMLADGSEAMFDVYRAHVIWNRRRILIDVEASEATPLVGMTLLAGCELRVEVWSGGKVSINRPT